MKKDISRQPLPITTLLALFICIALSQPTFALAARRNDELKEHRYNQEKEMEANSEEPEDSDPSQRAEEPENVNPSVSPSPEPTVSPDPSPTPEPSVIPSPLPSPGVIPATTTESSGPGSTQGQEGHQNDQNNTSHSNAPVKEAAPNKDHSTNSQTSTPVQPASNTSASTSQALQVNTSGDSNQSNESQSNKKEESGSKDTPLQKLSNMAADQLRKQVIIPAAIAKNNLISSYNYDQTLPKNLNLILSAVAANALIAAGVFAKPLRILKEIKTSFGPFGSLNKS